MNNYQHSEIISTGSRREVNITPAERLSRVLIGLAGAIGGILLLSGSPTWVTGILEVLLVLAGLDLIVTGATGHCPLYKKLGYTPASLKVKGGSREHHNQSARCH